MKVLVIGASRGTGRAAVTELLKAGHEVTAFARSVDALPEAPNLTRCTGDALDPSDVLRAVRGQDAVVVTLGITESPVVVRLGLQRTPIDLRSRGTANVIAAMRAHGVRRLLVQTTYGIGDSKGRLSFGWAMAFRLLLWPQILDSEVQESLVRESGLDWTLLQPVGLTERDTDVPALTSKDAEVRSMEVARSQVARVIATLTAQVSSGECIAISS